MANNSVNSQCCVFLRGKVYLRVVGQSSFREVGNSSQFRLINISSEYLPLSGELEPNCCVFEGVQVQLALRCFDDENVSLAFRNVAQAQAAGSVQTESFNITTAMSAGDLLPFSKIAEASTVQVTPNTLPFTATSIGLVAQSAIAAPQALTVFYNTRQQSKVNAGQICGEVYECLYAGVNAFDESSVIVKIPRMRLRPVQNFDWISETDAGQMLLEGELLPNATEPVWYSITREAPNQSC